MRNVNHDHDPSELCEEFAEILDSTPSVVKRLKTP